MTPPKARSSHAAMRISQKAPSPAAAPGHVALLRGVHVGKGNRVPMADFRLLLEALGHRSVGTLLNSGNAVFSASRGNEAALAAGIAEALLQRFGIATPVIVKSALAFDQVVAGNPFVPLEADHARFLVAFAMDTTKLEPLDCLHGLVAPGERFAITPHAASLYCAAGLRDSRAAEALLGRAGRGVTTRNWATVLKPQSLLGGKPAPRPEPGQRSTLSAAGITPRDGARPSTGAQARPISETSPKRPRSR
ncbi:DUF1697 domain-containing protein [Rubrivivax sp. RP6-9]|uniref:DUF1697 domain-containing protein n=1 Tax=Rubrivivax sp. RP6-9 TaxID=3415750 RepID=UPI003CC5EE9D